MLSDSIKAQGLNRVVIRNNAITGQREYDLITVTCSTISIRDREDVQAITNTLKEASEMMPEVDYVDYLAYCIEEGLLD